MAFDFPASPTNGQIYSPAGGPDYVWNSTTGAWEIKTTGTNSAFVAKIGDTMSGDLEIVKVDPVLKLGATGAGTIGNSIYGYKGAPGSATARWGMVLGNAAAESAANVGSDFGLIRYSDAGAVLGTPLFIERASGDVAINGNLQINKALAELRLSKTGALSENNIKGMFNSKLRWCITLGDSAQESPANAGSNFLLSRYDDNGNYLGSPYAIDRLNGNHTFYGSMYLRKPGGGPSPSINLYAGSTAGAVAPIIGYGPGDAARWSINMGDGAAEGAEGVGNNFAIWRCNNAGTGVEAPLIINRVDGGITLKNVGCSMMSVNNNTGYARMYMNCAPAANNALVFTANNLNKWDIGSSANNHDFSIARYDNAGNSLGGAVAINRLTGEMTLQVHPTTSNGVATKYYADSKVAKTGDTMSGSLTITGSYPSVILQRTDMATANQILGMNVAGNYRWVLNMGGGAEYGSNSGSDAAWGRFDDNGTYIDNPISLTRQTGNIIMSQFLLTRGYQSKQGYNGANGGNYWNWYWYGDGGGLQMWVDASYIGQVSVTSDYRIKKDIAPLDSMWAKVKALKPISYTQKEYSPTKAPEPVKMKDGGEYPNTHPTNPAPMFADDDTERWGFVAHELQETLIQTAATGVKDQADCVQSPNWPPIVAALTKALQEAMERIEALEARLPA